MITQKAVKRNLLTLATTLVLTLISVIAYAQKPNGYIFNPSTITVTVGSNASITPTRQSGSAATAFAISPATLPAGLLFSASTGAITGIPTTVTGQTTFTVTPSNASGNGTAFTIKLTISKGTIAITANDVNKTYGSTLTGGSGSTAFTVTGLAPGDNISTVTISYGSGASASSNAGINSNQVTPSAAVGTYNAANYNSIIYAKGDIIVGKATLTVSANNQTRAYGANNPGFTLTYSGFFNGDNTSALTSVPAGSTAATTNSNIGTYAITVSGGNDNNYTFAYVPGTLTITQANLVITANNSNKSYGTSLSSPASGSSVFTATGLASGQTITVTMTYSAANTATSPAGSTGTITPSAATGSGFSASNYNITYNSGTLTVTTAALTISANNVSHTYGTAITSPGAGASAFTSTGLKNGETIGSTTISYGTGASATSNAGTYTNQVIIASATGGTFNTSNYTITYNDGDITVNQASLVITLNIPNRTYGSPYSIFGNTTTSFTYSATVNGDSPTTVSFGSDYFIYNQFAGTTYNIYPFAITGNASFNANNYNITYVNTTGTIQKAPLTIAASNVNKNYGSVLSSPGNTAAGYTVNGLQNGEKINSTTITYGTGKNATDGVGIYTTIVPSASVGSNGYNANNYSITYTNGNLIVGAVNLTITATSTNKPYGTTLTSGPALNGYTISGLVNSETITSVYLTYSAGYNASDAIGTTGTITASLPIIGSGTFNTSNYNVTFTTGALTVGAATFDWIGAVNTDWTNPGNWSVNGVTQTSVYPGMNEATDLVRVGVIPYSNNANQPTVSANLPNSISMLTFGGATTPVTLNLASNISFNISGNTTLNTGSEVVNLNGASGSSFNISGDYVTSSGATFNNNSSAAITITGLFTNGGTSNFGSSLLTFNNPGNSVTFTTSSTQVFTNVLFTGTGHFLLKKTLGPSAGQYNIACNGTLTVAGTVNLSVAGAPFTLLSDSTGSAAVTAVPSGCQINGTVNVQRYMQAHRGYRLMASPVNGGSDGNSNYVYSVNYLKTATYLTGTTGTPGLFDKAGNPTLYLYREDIIANNNSFLTGNYRGMSDLSLGNNNPPSYSINNDGSGFNIPVSNGYLFYYRGSKNQKTLTQLTTAGAAATTDTLTSSGTLNVGQIVFRDWYTPGSTALGYSNPDTTIVGFNLAGNPYASSIDWETYNTTSPASGIYGQNISDFVYELNPTTSNYDVYEAGKGGTVFTNKATRTIVSGQGFFVMANGAGAQLIFNESAKNTASQNTGQNLYMGKPADMTASNQYLKLQMAMDNINTDDMVIVFNNNAKTSFDLKEDAPYKIGSGKVSLASLSSDQKLLAINRMPLNQVTVAIPLKVNATSNGTYSLNMNALKGIPELYDVWLMDAYRKDSLDMRHNKTYMFDVVKSDTASYGAYRFKLVMRQNPALAYHLLNFTAIKSNVKQVQLNWVTEHEANYTNFSVERSTDGGKTYLVIGSAPATGAGSYGLMDKNPGANNLYRLKQEDINNNIMYSPIIPVGFSNLSNNLATSKINVYPNPASDAVHMSVSSAIINNAPTYNFTITNSYGLQIKQGTSSQATWQTNVSDLLPGTYVIQIVNNKDKSFVGKSKFVKL